MSIHDETIDPAVPALLVTVGNTARKHRPLDRDVVVLGRAHGCDIGLSAPDVSSIHCVLYKTAQGLRIRDCQSRSGTHVNGQVIQEQFLRDGDAIQVGPFSFQAYIPAEFAESSPPAAADKCGQPEQDAELDRQVELLRGKAREYEQKARELDQAERDLVQARAVLDGEIAAQEQRQQRTEQELAHRQAALEHDVEAQWQAWQRYQEAHEETGRRLLAQQASLEEAIRDTAAELDRERAKLATERNELERQRREQQVSERLTPLQHFKEELDHHRYLAGLEPAAKG